MFILYCCLWGRPIVCPPCILCKIKGQCKDNVSIPWSCQDVVSLVLVWILDLGGLRLPLGLGLEGSSFDSYSGVYVCVCVEEQCEVQDSPRGIQYSL